MKRVSSVLALLLSSWLACSGSENRYSFNCLIDRFGGLFCWSTELSLDSDKDAQFMWSATVDGGSLTLLPDATLVIETINKEVTLALVSPTINQVEQIEFLKETKVRIFHPPCKDCNLTCEVSSFFNKEYCGIGSDEEFFAQVLTNGSVELYQNKEEVGSDPEKFACTNDWNCKGQERAASPPSRIEITEQAKLKQRGSVLFFHVPMKTLKESQIVLKDTRNRRFKIDVDCDVLDASLYQCQGKLDDPCPRDLVQENGQERFFHRCRERSIIFIKGENESFWFKTREGRYDVTMHFNQTQTQTQLDRDKDLIKALQGQLDQTKAQLNQSSPNAQLNQTQTLLDQTQTLLDQAQTLLDQAKELLDKASEPQASLYKTRTLLDQADFLLGQVPSLQKVAQALVGIDLNSIHSGGGGGVNNSQAGDGVNSSQAGDGASEDGSSQSQAGDGASEDGSSQSQAGDGASEDGSSQSKAGDVASEDGLSQSQGPGVEEDGPLNTKVLFFLVALLLAFIAYVNRDQLQEQCSGREGADAEDVAPSFPPDHGTERIRIIQGAPDEDSDTAPMMDSPPETGPVRTPSKEKKTLRGIGAKPAPAPKTTRHVPRATLSDDDDWGTEWGAEPRLASKND